MENNKKKPEGFYKSRGVIIGFAVCAAIGIPLSIILENMSYTGIGVIAGVLVGSLIGESIEKKHAAAGNIREMNEDEIRKKKNQFKILLIAGVVGFIILMVYQVS